MQLPASFTTSISKCAAAEKLLVQDFSSGLQMPLSPFAPTVSDYPKPVASEMEWVLAGLSCFSALLFRGLQLLRQRARDMV